MHIRRLISSIFYDLFRSTIPLRSFETTISFCRKIFEFHKKNKYKLQRYGSNICALFLRVFFFPNISSPNTILCYIIAVHTVFVYTVYILRIFVNKKKES